MNDLQRMLKDIEMEVRLTRHYIGKTLWMPGLWLHGTSAKA